MKNTTLASRSRSDRRKRGVARLFVLGAAFAASTTVATPLTLRLHAQAPPRARSEAPAAGVAAQSTAALAFAIEGGSLASVMAEFRRLTGIAVAFADDGLGMIQSAGVSGTLTPQQALERLLMGTSVRATFTGPTSVTLDVGGVREFVEVTGGTQRILGSRALTAPLRDIPQTINVIPNEVMQQQGATTLRDVLRNVSGITFQAGEGGGGLPGDNLTMRGFSAGNDMFIDGLRDPGGYSRDAFNLEQVEVAKGPSSSIAGRGSTGGAINQVTKAPSLRQAMFATLGVGNADYRRGTVDLNQPFTNVESGAAFRLNAMWTDAGVPGRDVVENGAWGVAPSLALGLNTPTQVTLKYQRLQQDNVPDYGLPWGASAGFPTGAFQATPAIDQSNFYGLRNYDFEDIRSDIGTAEVSHRFGNVALLRNTTRYSETGRDSAITAPRPPNRQLQRRQMTNGTVANQTNLLLSLPQGTSRHDVVAGIEVSRERTENQNSAQTTNQPQTNIISPDPTERPFGPMPAITGNPSHTTLNQVGAYLFDTLNLDERWQLTGGARLDTVDVDYRLTTLATGVVDRIETDDTMLSWRGGVVYKPRRNGSVYIGYGTSFNPSVDAAATGAALSTAPTAANNPNLEPEESRNFEIGTKWDEVGGRLALSGAFFRTEKVNARTRNAAADPFVLSGKQRVQGVELGVSGSITDSWTALASYAFMDSEIAASANAAEEGQDLTLTPESTFSLWTTVQLPRGISVGGGAQFMDAVFRNTANTTSVPSYWLVNALASYAVNSNLTLRLNGQNLGDAQYVDRVGGGHYIPGPRRQVILSTDVTF